MFTSPSLILATVVLKKHKSLRRDAHEGLCVVPAWEGAHLAHTGVLIASCSHSKTRL